MSSKLERIACLYLPDFALQVHRRLHPQINSSKFAIVDRDHPQGKLLAVDPCLLPCAITRGMRYSQALSLDLELCAVEWDAQAMAKAHEALAQSFLQWTPEVEQYPESEGVFWLSFRGMQRLFPKEESWAQGILSQVQSQGWQCKLCLGFGRRSSYAAALLAPQELWQAESRKQELALASQLPLARLAISPKEEHMLESLGVRTLGQLWALDYRALHDRFSPCVAQWHGIEKQNEWGLGEKIKEKESIKTQLDLDHAIRRTPLLISYIEKELKPLAAKLLARGYEISGAQIDLFVIAQWGKHQAYVRQEELRLAEPSRDLGALLRLIELRFESEALQAPVNAIALCIQGSKRLGMQQALWGSLQTRNLVEGEQALAVIRAELGNDAVQQAVICDSHIPEQRFRWEPFTQLKCPPKLSGVVSGLVRRIEIEAKKIRRHYAGAQDITWGPFLLESDWWSEHIQREEYYLQNQEGFLQWVFFDKNSQSWFSQGEVG